MDFHPGGSRILRDWAGKNATAAFKEYHSNWEKLLESYRYLRASVVVPERAPGDLAATEISLHGVVYNIGRLEVTNYGLYKALEGYAGLEADDVFRLEFDRDDDVFRLESDRDDDVEDALLELSRMSHLIVGKIWTGLGLIHADELALRDGRPVLRDSEEEGGGGEGNEHPKQEEVRAEAWVSVNQDVYNVTCESPAPMAWPAIPFTARS